MAQISILTYHFRIPDPIGEIEYKQIKRELDNNPSFSLEDPSESFTYRFGKIFRYYLYNIPITTIVCFVLISIADAFPRDSFGENLFGILGVLGGLWAVMSIFVMPMFALPTIFSYARYLRHKRAYFSQLIYFVKKSSSYNEFYRNMYGV